jgi:AcrR family transcriptional regulator
MSPASESVPAAGQRGPAEHVIRAQIVEAARLHFRHYGYGKTTVADLAKAIGFSKAYVYKFFESKQAIGEAIVVQVLDQISAAAEAEAAKGRTAEDKYRRFFRTIVDSSADLLFNERRLYDIAAVGTVERWPPYLAYLDALRAQLRTIILFGRDSGEFERETPVDDTCRAILQVMQPFVSPAMLEYNLDRVRDGPAEVASLVLRSLAR